MDRFIKFRPSSTLRELQANANKVFERLFRGEREDGQTPTSGILVLQTDVLETGEGYRVRAELPGVNRKDIKIDATHKRLTIRGHSRKSTRENGQQSDTVEAPDGCFCRSIALPSRINPSRMNAVFKSGILIIDLPKSNGRRDEGPGRD